MRISILCIGRIRGGPAMALYEDYAARLPWPIVLKEFEEQIGRASWRERV